MLVAYEPMMMGIGQHWDTTTSLLTATLAFQKLIFHKTYTG